MAAGNAAGKQNSGAGISRHIFHTTAYFFFFILHLFAVKRIVLGKKRCDVLDETLGLYEICLQVTQQRKMVCVVEVTKLCVKDGVCERWRV